MKQVSNSPDQISAQLRSARMPRLRPDVEIAGLADRRQIRIWYDNGRWVDLWPLDCLIAQQMDGSRSIEQLIQFARQHDPAIGRPHIERLVADLHSLGLLIDPQRPAPPAQKEGKILPLLTRSRPTGEQASVRGDAGDSFSEDTTVDRGWAEPEARTEPVDRLEPEFEPEPEAEPEPAPEPPRAPEPPPSPAESSEQEALWQEMRARKWHQRTWLRILLAVAALVLVAAVVPYPLKITSEAIVVPTERALVRSEMAGLIAEIAVDEGQAVTKGQVLARLDDRELETERRKALAEIDRLEAELDRLVKGARAEEIARQRAVVAAAGNEVAYARRQAARKTRMAREGVGSVQARDQALHELRVKQKALAEASASLRLLRAGSRPEEIEAREAELDRGRAQLAFVQKQLERTVIRAPLAGILLTPKFRERLHERIEAGGLVCQIAKTDRMRAEIYVPEGEVDSISVGQPVVVKVQSYPTREFEGKVDFLAPIVEKRDDQNRVRVVAELDNPEGLLKQDMTGYGEIRSGTRSVLAILTRRLLRWVRVRFLL